MPIDPCLLAARSPAEKVPVLGHPVLDRYLLFVGVSLPSEHGPRDRV